MKINLELDVDINQFMVHPHNWNGELLWLIQPNHIGCKFTQRNKHFRSSVWNGNGELVSAGFPKFVNWGENPDNFPVPDSLKNSIVVDKLDGSLLIVSKYKGNVMLRTRGTIDASTMDNGHELQLFKDTILKRLNNDEDTWNYSILFEWTSPENRIVIRYGDIPLWKLVGMVDHETYALIQQPLLDLMANKYNLLRPETLTFSDISQMLTEVDMWIGKEGVVVYSTDGQTLHKCKSSDYLIKHRLKESFSNLEQVLDFFIQLNCPMFNIFKDEIENVTDFETANECIGDISKCADAWKEVSEIITGMNHFIQNTLLPMGDPTDKKQRGLMAQKVIQSYGITNRASFIFKLLDEKLLEKDDLKKLCWQVLKK